MSSSSSSGASSRKGPYPVQDERYTLKRSEARQRSPGTQAPNQRISLGAAAPQDRLALLEHSLASSRSLGNVNKTTEEDTETSVLGKVGSGIKKLWGKTSKPGFDRKSSRLSGSSSSQLFRNRTPESRASDRDESSTKGEEKSLRDLEKLMPAPEVLNAMFEQMLNDMAFTPAVKEVMRSFDNNKKWTLVCQNQYNIHSNLQTRSESPESWAKKLETDYSVSEVFLQLRPVLNSARRQWIEDFVNIKGLKNLMKAGKKLHSEPGKSQELLFHCLGCLEAFMNSENGVESIVADPEVLRDLVSWFDSYNPRVKAMVLQLLSVICFMGGSHGILEAFSSHKEEIGLLEPRFISVFKFLKEEAEMTSRKSTLVFINTLINFTDRLEIRTSVRREFLILGIKGFLEDLRALLSDKKGNYEAEIILNQCKVFDTSFADDNRELSFGELDLSDPLALFQLLQTRAIEDDAVQSLLTCLQGLTTIPRGEEGKRVWRIVAKVLSSVRGDQIESFGYEHLKSVLEGSRSNEFVLKSEVEGLSLLLKEKDSKIAELLSEKKELEAKLSARPRLEALTTAPLKEASVSVVTPAHSTSPHSAPQVVVSAPVAPVALPSPPPPAPGALVPPPPPVPGVPLPPPAPGALVTSNSTSFDAPPPGRDKRKPLSRDPSVKLKQVHWSKIPNSKIEGTIWQELRDIDIKMTEEEIVSLFSQKTVQKKHVVVEEEEKQKIIKLIDDKRSYNVDLSLARFRTSPEVIRDALRRADQNLLNEEVLQQLLNVIPTPDEVDTVRAFDGDVQLLGNTEKFFLTLSEIPYLTERVSLWLFELSFDEIVFDLERKIMHVRSGLKELRSSTKLRKLLEIILAVGNVLNYGTKNGDAYGFRASALKTLNATKTIDNKSSLLDYIFEWTEKNSADVVCFPDELPSIADASRVEQKPLIGEVGRLKGMITNLNTFLKFEHSGSDALLVRLRVFAERANSRFSQVQQDLDSVSKEAVDVVSFFGENPATSWDELFIMFKDFMEVWKASESALIKAREKESKDRRRKEAADRKKQVKPSPGTPLEPVSEARVDSGESRNVQEVFEQMASADPKVIMEQLKQRRAMRKRKP